MAMILFLLFVFIVSSVFVVTAIKSHFIGSARQIAAWWAGVILCAILLAYSQSLVTGLPLKDQIVSLQSGCEVGTRTVKVTNWDAVFSDATRVEWMAVLAGVILALFAFEILERWVPLPDKVLSLVMLLLSLTSLTLLVYIFLIRKFTYLFFSATMGAVFGSLIHRAFLFRRGNAREKRPTQGST